MISVDNDCMIRFGRRWIGEAAAAPAEMGIPAPDGIIVMPEDAPPPAMPVI